MCNKLKVLSPIFWILVSITFLISFIFNWYIGCPLFIKLLSIILSIFYICILIIESKKLYAYYKAFRRIP